jgi:hypothetical protein
MRRNLSCVDADPAHAGPAKDPIGGDRQCYQELRMSLAKRADD